MHPIKRYCRKHKITQREFARKVGLSEAYVSQLISGVWPAGRGAAKKIEQGTAGEIKFIAVMTWEPAADEQRSAQGKAL